MKSLIATLAVMVLPALALANPLGEAQAEIYVLGEVHDNPAHHAVQAEAVAAIEPRAVVFEMLTEEQAGRIDDDLIDDADKLGERLEWTESGWPDFDMYYPIFAAAKGAEIRGAAVPRAEARTALQIGVAPSFGAQSDAFGLTAELDAEQLADRLNLQLAAHCNALPVELLPGMVELQRLRDAVLARVALDALEETGGPVVVITGNGHARKDWGVPSYLARVAPEVAVFALGQSEDGEAPDGAFDLVLDADSVEREDPCLAFQ